MKRIKGKLLTGAVLAGALLLLLAGCGNDKNNGSASTDLPEGTAVETAIVSVGTRSNESTLSGKLIAGQEASVFSPLPTTIASVSVKVGDSVTQDQVLFTLDKTDIESQYDPLLKQYNQTKDLMDDSTRVAQEALDNTKSLYEIGAASKLEVEQAELQLKQQKSTASSTLQQLEDGLKNVQSSLDDATVKAPIAGRVTAVNVVANTTATQQMAAVTIADTQQMQVSVSVSETLLSAIAAGDSVTVSVPAASSSPFGGKVRSVAPAADTMTQLYEVKVDIPTRNTFQLGMFADVTFVTEKRANAVSVPSEAILTDGDTNYVFMVQGGDTAKRIVVTTGMVSGDLTEITSGLTGGETVVTVGQSYLADGDTVRVTGTADAEDLS